MKKTARNAIVAAIEEANEELRSLLVKHTKIEREIQSARERISIQLKHLDRVEAAANGK